MVDCYILPRLNLGQHCLSVRIPIFAFSDHKNFVHEGQLYNIPIFITGKRRSEQVA